MVINVPQLGLSYIIFPFKLKLDCFSNKASRILLNKDVQTLNTSISILLNSSKTDQQPVLT